MSTVKINEQFMAHRKVCRVCATDGAAVCEIGMNLLRMFQKALVESVQQELRERAKRASA